MSCRRRPWAGSADTAGMQRLASRCWPNGVHPGGLGWSLAIDQLATELVVVVEDRDLLGWAGVTQPGSLVLQVTPDRPDVIDELVGWLVQTAAGPELTVDVHDDATEAGLRGHGFGPLDAPAGFYRMGMPGLGAAVETVTGTPAPGYVIDDVHHVTARDRVEVHRAAWRPADLPFTPGKGPELDPAATSVFTEEHYRRVRSTPLYDPSLDLVAIAPDGSPAGCCLGWLDPETGWAEIEPLGVVPAHRRRGLAGALCAAVAERVAHRGGRQLFINTGDSEEYPVPYAAYTKAGFTPFVRGVSLTLARPSGRP